MKEKTLANDLTQGNVAQQLLRFASPLFLSGLLQMVYNMVDMVVVGHVVGSAGLSAVSMGGDILMILSFISMGFSNAGQVVIAQYTGAGRRDLVTKLIGTLFTFLGISALCMTVITLALRPTLLQLMNTPAESLEYANSYVMVCSLGLVFTYGYNVVSAILRGMGDSKHPFMFIATASVLNLILDLVFVAGFGLGPGGAALATVIAQGTSFICALTFLYRKREAFGFDFNPSSFRIHWVVFKPLIKLGIPMMLQTAAISASKLFITSWINTYGYVATAVTGMGNKVSTIVNLFAQALSTAGGAMIGQNIGAQKYDRVPKVIGTAMLFDGVVAALLAVVTVLFPRALFGLFTTEPETLDMAVNYVPVLLVLYGCTVLRSPMMSLVNGSGHSRLNLLIGLLDGVVFRIGFAWVLGAALDFGIYGFWFGNAISSGVPFLIGFPFFLSGKWKTRRHIFEDNE